MLDAMEAAIEQARHWQTYMTAREAANAVGISDHIHSWAPVIRRLAIMWREMQAEKAENIPLKRAA